MAENKEVVEMFDKFLASLVKLLTKWLTEWAVDSRKLFHALQQVRKQDLIGLIEGTHEIRVKVTTSKTVSTNEDFECIYTSELITIPDMGAISADCKKLWGHELGNAPIPEGLKTGVQKRVRIIRLKKTTSSQKIIDHLKQYAGVVLPNIFGLRIAELNCLSNIPKDTWVRGIDEKGNLSKGAAGDLMVPSAYFDFDGSVSRDSGLWIGSWVPGYCVVVFCD